MHLILGFVLCSRSHQLEPLLKRIDGYVTEMRLIFMQSLTFPKGFSK